VLRSRVVRNLVGIRPGRERIAQARAEISMTDGKVTLRHLAGAEGEA